MVLSDPYIRPSYDVLLGVFCTLHGLRSKNNKNTPEKRSRKTLKIPYTQDLIKLIFLHVLVPHSSLRSP